MPHLYAEIVTWLIVVFGTVNLARMTFFMVGSDIYDVTQARQRAARRYGALPRLSVVIPAHNEEHTIRYTLGSVLAAEYPADKLEIIVVNDGSTDATSTLVRECMESTDAGSITLIEQANAGKANALNNGMRHVATGELVMCLDADSSIAPDALRKAARYFADERVVALSANVKIRPTGTLFNLIQRFEYIICYRMKRALTTCNIEYIIGGIGSTFRTSALKQVGYYDTDTVTEDIDLTLKLLQLGGKDNRVIYGSDVITYTESVLDLRGLIRQRYRWKHGRNQTFYKNANLFFASGSAHAKPLTWLYLPFAIFSDIAFFFEPFMVSFILYVVIRYQDWVALVSAMSIISFYILMNVIAEDTIAWRDKLRLVLVAPSMYLFFYVLSFVEYVALIRGTLTLHTIPTNLASGTCHWQHVERAVVVVK